MTKVESVEAAANVPRLLSWRDAFNVAVIGLVVGLLTLAIYFMLDRYVLAPALCNDTGTGVAYCESKEYYASALAMVIGGLGGLFALVQQRAFRPLLVVLLVIVGLWNVVVYMSGMVWWMNALVGALLFGVAYVAFTWLVQLRNFYVALGVSTLVVVLMRLILIS